MNINLLFYALYQDVIMHFLLQNNSYLLQQVLQLLQYHILSETWFHSGDNFLLSIWQSVSDHTIAHLFTDRNPKSVPLCLIRIDIHNEITVGGRLSILIYRLEISVFFQRL